MGKETLISFMDDTDRLELYTKDTALMAKFENIPAFVVVDEVKQGKKIISRVYRAKKSNLSFISPPAKSHHKITPLPVSKGC